MEQFSYQYGVAGMSNIDEKEFFSLDDNAAKGIVPKTSSENLSDIDLSLTQEKDVSKKSFHNFKRVLKKSPARSIASAGVVTIAICGIAFYSLGSTDIEAKAGRDMAGLDTVQFDQSALGRENLTQSQVDHIQSKNQEKAMSAANSNSSFTPQFSDVLVTTEGESESMTDDLQPTQVSFDGGVNVKGSNFADPNVVAQTSLANGVNYGQPKTGTGQANYATGGGSAMPVPAAQKQGAQPMQQGSGSPDATYQTNGTGGNGGGGSNGDGGMGAGGPNATGIDPSIEALRQSLEDDYTQNQQYQQQSQATQQEYNQQRQQYLQEQIQQRQEATATALQQQQTNFLQPNSSSFTASTYIPKQSSTSLPTWNNSLSGLANNTTPSAGANSSNGSTQTPAKEFAKDLPNYVVRVGTTWQVVVENQVNTDNGTTVFARVLSGPYSGSRLIGSIKATGLGDRSAGVLFETLIPTRANKNALPIQAVGMTLGDLNTHIATSVNRHYLQRYSALIAQGITGGYAEAYEDTSGSSSQIVNPDGTVVTVSTSEKPDSDEIRGQVIGQLGGELKGEFGKIRARPTTYVIAQGTPLTIMFTQNLDTKTATTSSISIGQGSSSTYSNTSSYGMTPRTVN